MAHALVTAEATRLQHVHAVVVTIDGPSGSGKSSVAKAVASHKHWQYLDTGAMYRALTWWALQRGLAPNDAPERLTECDLSLTTDSSGAVVTVNGEDVTEAIRTPEVTAAVSAYSAMPEVRAKMLVEQREVADSADGLVCEGRDMGTVVFPEADVKIFLTADVAARATRRAAENADRGHDDDVDSTAESLEQRDAADSGRAVSPLTPAHDAIHVDATFRTLPEVIDTVLGIIEDRLS